MKKILLATAIITIAFTACKKSSVETPAPAAPTHLGLWKGKYSNSPITEPTFPMFALLTKDGNAKVYNGADTATAIQKSLAGSWSLTGNEITIFYTFTDLNGILSIHFWCDKNFTKSDEQFSANRWGTGYYGQNGFNIKGNVSFTKP
jgi:hypothetical protein